MEAERRQLRESVSEPYPDHTFSRFRRICTVLQYGRTMLRCAGLLYFSCAANNVWRGVG